MAELAFPKVEERKSAVRIQPSRGWLSLELGELWKYRELLYFLAWRDVKVRYKQSLLGAGWAILQPLLTMVIFTFVFNKFAGVDSEGIPYPVFAYAALLPWQYFASAIGRSGVSLVNSSNLITKVYFPRLIVPLAAAIAPLVDFAVAFVILIAMMLFYGISPTRAVFTLPVFLLLAFITALAVSLWLSALNVRYRDVGYVIPFMVQAWMYISPVAYPSDLVPAQWRWLYGLNPMAGVIEGFRWALLGNGQVPDFLIIISSGIVLVILVGGLIYFQHTEETFADVI
jgi:lipopolysaccharide transport system permease protein